MTETKVTENEIFSTDWTDALTPWSYSSWDATVRTAVITTATVATLRNDGDLQTTIIRAKCTYL